MADLICENCGQERTGNGWHFENNEVSGKMESYEVKICLSCYLVEIREKYREKEVFHNLYCGKP